MIKQLTRNIIWIGLLTLVTSQAWAISVTATVDKNPVIVDESFTLTITADDDLPRTSFRPDELLNNFVVGGTSVDRSTQLIQGQMSRQTRWRVTLVARRAGQFEIPSFTIENQRTAPIVLDVVEASASDSQRGPVFITAEVDNESPYIQQQIRYTVRLHLANSLETGSISPPQIENADIQQANNDDDSQTLIDGQRYRVITRTYFITPRRSGQFYINGSRFDGQIRDNSSHAFATLSRPQTVTALAPDIELTVRPQPADFDATWLPSEQVTLEETWQDDQRFIVGEPINRQITLTSQGVRHEQLPDIEFSYPANLRYYPERTDRDSFSRAGQRFAQAIFRGVIIPSQAGTYSLPPVEVSWWDVASEELRTARIEGREIEVHEPAGGMASPTSMPLANASNGPTEQPSIASQGATQQSWWSISASIFLALWLVTLASLIGVILYHRKAKNQTGAKAKPVKSANQVPLASRKPLKSLKSACYSGDPEKAQQALIAWAKSKNTQGSLQGGLQSVARELNSIELEQAILELEASLYSKDRHAWAGGPALWQAIQKLHHIGPEQRKKSELPSLYGK